MHQRHHQAVGRIVGKGRRIGAQSYRYVRAVSSTVRSTSPKKFHFRCVIISERLRECPDVIIMELHELSPQAFDDVLLRPHCSLVELVRFEQFEQFTQVTHVRQFLQPLQLTQ